MKSTVLAVLTALVAQEVAGHATWQELWVNGVDQAGTCARLPLTNSPVTDVTLTDIACNAGTTPVAAKCTVAAGGTVTIEMHQQAGDRSCTNEAIGGAHYGPVQAYLSKVGDATTAVGSAGGWFKIFSDSWAKASSTSQGSDDYWGTKDLNLCCGKMNLKIPSDIASGDYLLRAEAIALHSASGLNGAQNYITCFQLSITGGGSASPATVSFPGAYAATDPGLEINIYQTLATYVAPGPTVYSGGVVQIAGATDCAAASSTAVSTSPATTLKTSTTATTTTAAASPTSATSTAAAATSTAASGTCAALYGQCGGSGWAGSTCCASGSCQATNSYYSQCL